MFLKENTYDINMTFGLWILEFLMAIHIWLICIQIPFQMLWSRKAKFPENKICWYSCRSFYISIQLECQKCIIPHEILGQFWSKCLRNAIKFTEHSIHRHHILSSLQAWAERSGIKGSVNKNFRNLLLVFPINYMKAFYISYNYFNM